MQEIFQIFSDFCIERGLSKQPPQTVKKGQQKLAFFDTIKSEVRIC